jgi:hypothetical protein
LGGIVKAGSELVIPDPGGSLTHLAVRLIFEG